MQTSFFYPKLKNRLGALTNSQPRWLSTLKVWSRSPYCPRQLSDLLRSSALCGTSGTQATAICGAAVSAILAPGKGEKRVEGLQEIFEEARYFCIHFLGENSTGPNRIAREVRKSLSSVSRKRQQSGK